jgi:hypothetical protein
MVARAADRRRRASGQRPERALADAAGKDHPLGGDRALRGDDPGDAPTAQAQPDHGRALVQRHAGIAHGDQIGGDVARRRDGAVVGAIRRAEDAVGVEQRQEPRRLLRPDPARIDPVLALHSQPLMRRRHLVVREGDDEVAERAEVAVDRGSLVELLVEGHAEARKLDRGRRAALRAHDPGRARARPLSRDARVEHEHAADALARREDRGPAADRAGADDDEVRAQHQVAASARASVSTALAALRPLSAITLPPGWVAAPQKYNPGTGVRGVSRCSHI